MKEQEDIDQLFKSAFDDFEVAPPPAVKQSIDLAIAGKPKKFPYWIVAILLLVTTAVIAGIFMFNSEQQTQLAATTKQENTENTASTQALSVEAEPGKTDETHHNTGNASVKSVSAQSASSAENTGGKKTGNKGKSTAQNAGGAFRSGQEKSTKNQTASETSSSQKARAASRSKQSKRTKKDSPSAGSTKQNPVNPLSSAYESNADDPAKNNSSEGSTQNEDPKQEAVKQASKTEEASKTEQTAAKDTLTPYAEEDTTVVPPKNRQKEKQGLLLSLKPGTTFGFNQRKDTSSIVMKERSAFFIQAEATYGFTPRLAVTSGLSYEGWKEDYSRTGLAIDTVVTGYYYEYISDSSGIIDSILTPIYETQTATVELRNSYKLYSIGVPVFFTYSQSLSQKLNLDLSAGAILGIQGSKTVSEEFDMGSATVNKFGLKTCLRAQLRYQFSSWGVSLNTNFGYDLFPVHSWEQLDRTSRMFLNVGAGVHYQIGK